MTKSKCGGSQSENPRGFVPRAFMAAQEKSTPGISRAVAADDLLDQFLAEPSGRGPEHNKKQ